MGNIAICIILAPVTILLGILSLVSPDPALISGRIGLSNDNNICYQIDNALTTRRFGITASQNSDSFNFDAGSHTHRIKIIIDHTRITAPLSNFPVLIYLGVSAGIGKTDVSSIFTELGNNSQKIAITLSDRETECYVEIEKWDSVNRQAWLWVKVPNISDSTDTILYLYYDINQVDNYNMVGETGSVPAEKVWSDSFVMVQHLDENSVGSTGEFLDSTSRHNNGTGYGVPVRKMGKVAEAQYFDGDNDYILVSDSDDLSLNTTWGLTISWWFSPTVLNWRKNDGSGDYINMFGKGGYPNGWEWAFGLGLQTSPNKPQQINTYHHNPPGGRGIGSGTSDPYKIGDWIYVVGRYNKNNVDIFTFYPTGLKSRSNIYSKATGYADAIVPQNTWSPVTIGTIVTQWQMYEGLIDEVYISNSYQSDAWIKASYYSQSDNLVTLRLLQDQSLEINSIGDKTVQVGQQLSFRVSATGPEDIQLIYSASNLPAGAVFNPSNQVFSWTPGFEQIGIYAKVHFEVNNGNQIDAEDVTITVNNAAQPAGNNSGQPTGNGNHQPTIPISLIIGIAVAIVASILAMMLWRRRHQ